MTARLIRRVEHDFPNPGVSQEVVREVGETTSRLGITTADEIERVQAAIVFLAGGSSERLYEAFELAETDWRDLLVRGRLMMEDWSVVMDEQLGPVL